MTTLGIIHLPNQAFPTKHVKDATGKECTGWFVVENGSLGYPHATKELALKQASGINAIRCANLPYIKVINPDGTATFVPFV